MHIHTMALLNKTRLQSALPGHQLSQPRQRPLTTASKQSGHPGRQPFRWSPQLLPLLPLRRPQTSLAARASMALKTSSGHLARPKLVYSLQTAHPWSAHHGRPALPKQPTTVT